MIIYLVRHEETHWNKKGIVQGHKDSALTLNGKINAEDKGKILKGKNIEIIYSSDLGRCIQTAGIINKHLGKELITTSQLRERDFGSLNGQHWEKVESELSFSDYCKIAPNGESCNQMKNRFFEFIHSLPDKKLQEALVVTHGGPIRAVLSNFYKKVTSPKECGCSRKTIYKFELKNNKIEKLEFLNNAQ
ncbi:MAG: histidine phosphatase family protein [Candidatus Aenigmarchaeota archaeon]|nr:histidine phosphatase family protein [Candidatus Aenigmarchaeota archaeon]